jgi:putative ATPase
MRGLGYGEGYRYPHDYAGAAVEQNYMPDVLKDRRYYAPTERGYEGRIRQFLEQVRSAKRSSTPSTPDRSVIDPSDRKR